MCGPREEVGGFSGLIERQEIHALSCAEIQAKREQEKAREKQLSDIEFLNQNVVRKTVVK